MIWKIPPRIKVFEALGSLADGRVEIVEGKGKDSRLRGNDNVTSANVRSSDGSKFYTVLYDETQNAITSNDNGSRWQGYLGYPSIAFLMKLGKLPFDQRLAEGLKGIAWKAINTKYKNDWDKTEAEIFENLDANAYAIFAKKCLEQIDQLSMIRLQK